MHHKHRITGFDKIQKVSTKSDFVATMGGTVRLVNRVDKSDKIRTVRGWRRRRRRRRGFICEQEGGGGGGGGGERLIKDLKRKANSLSRDTRQANALGLEGGPPPLGNCSTRHD